MDIKILIGGSAEASTRYIGWSRTKCELRFTALENEQLPSRLLLQNIQDAQAGKIVFLRNTDDQENDQLELTIPLGATQIEVYIAGKYPHYSKDGRDAGIEIIDPESGALLHREAFMVRVRRNANKLSEKEKKVFLETLQVLNDKGKGRFAEFRSVHSVDPQNLAEGNKYYFQAHGSLGFLPWHRAFLLDLEREMQKIEPSVTLPYWKFDEVAEKVFTEDFMGSHASGNVKFSKSNPIDDWLADGMPIRRTADFNVLTQPAHNEFGASVLREEQVIAADSFIDFTNLEGNPHSTAHTSFNLDLTNAHTAVKDPLFFLLHTNVDRIWARWQWEKDFFDKNNESVYPQNSNEPEGHNLNDTMWPWNNASGGSRPATAPGGTLAPSPLVNAPGLRPKVSDMIDWQGRLNSGDQLGFDYDNIPFKKFRDPLVPIAAAITFAQPEGSFTVSNLKETELLTGQVKSLALDALANEAGNLAIRKMVIQKSGASIRNEDLFISSLLSILGRKTEPVALRLSALVQLQQLSITSAKFPASRAEFANILRGIVDDPDHTLRKKAIMILAMQKDRYVREKLIEGLKDPNKALISPQDAIQLLRYDIHADLYPILTEIINNPPNNDARNEAILLLGQDAGSALLISKILMDKNEPVDVRIIAAKALQTADEGLFNTLSKGLVSEDDEDEELRIKLLSSLSFSTAIPAIGQDQGFINKVNKLHQQQISGQMQVVSERFLHNLK
ncbi:tyrosinase family protein [Pedobacter caeni]|uniref:Common central domain of tyrosinase n=1 Tax=Pedobacter caeni TaxID=288992 RepID=A0A1M5KSP5_9SPHI|nr:tyrosinase family protein [Pedobacter caeni]SHG55765.1 Common central domain of tyrosinase [Pedobacter caeni]